MGDCNNCSKRSVCFIVEQMRKFLDNCWIYLHKGEHEFEAKVKERWFKYLSNNCREYCIKLLGGENGRNG
jgi:hypothetical protein